MIRKLLSSIVVCWVLLQAKLYSCLVILINLCLFQIPSLWFWFSVPQIKALYPYLCAFSFVIPTQICIAKGIFVFLLTSSIFWCAVCTYMTVYFMMMNRCKSVFNCLWKLAMVNTSCKHNAGCCGACKACVAGKAYSLFLPPAHFI